MKKSPNVALRISRPAPDPNLARTYGDYLRAVLAYDDARYARRIAPAADKAAAQVALLAADTVLTAARAAYHAARRESGVA